MSMYPPLILLYHSHRHHYDLINPVPAGVELKAAAEPLPDPLPPEEEEEEIVRAFEPADPDPEEVEVVIGVVEGCDGV